MTIHDAALFTVEEFIRVRAERDALAQTANEYKIERDLMHQARDALAAENQRLTERVRVLEDALTTISMGPVTKDSAWDAVAISYAALAKLPNHA